MTFAISDEAIEQTADRIYRYMLADHSGNWGMDLHRWDWVPGVGVVSMLSYGENAGKTEVLDELLRWVRKNSRLSERARVINSMAPYAIYPSLYRHSRDSALLEKAVEIGRWMLAEAPRTREGAFEHTVTEDASFPEQVWADTVFMAVLFLARLARLTENASYANEAIAQLDVHLRLLQDEETGVLFHGWNCIARNHMSAARWTRANAWIAVGAPMIAQELKGLAAMPEHVLERYRAMMRGLLRYQRPDGLWTTVMDRPDFYPETSGSAGIACGILKGIRQGLLDVAFQDAAYRAAEAIVAGTLPSGEVTGVSGGTPVMPTLQAYNEIPLHPTLYGQGLALMLLSELTIR